MSRTLGSKNSVSLPTSYDIGDGAINLVMAVVTQAKKDEDTKYEDGFWVEFIATETYRQGLQGDVNILAVVCGLASYWWG